MSQSSDEVSNLAKQARLETLKSKLASLTLAEFHEALALCEDLDLATGTDSTWVVFKRELERIQQRAIAERRKQ